MYGIGQHIYQYFFPPESKSKPSPSASILDDPTKLADLDISEMRKVFADACKEYAPSNFSTEELERFRHLYEIKALKLRIETDAECLKDFKKKANPPKIGLPIRIFMAGTGLQKAEDFVLLALRFRPSLKTIAIGSAAVYTFNRVVEGTEKFIKVGHVGLKAILAFGAVAAAVHGTRCLLQEDLSNGVSNVKKWCLGKTASAPSKPSGKNAGSPMMISAQELEALMATNPQLFT